MDSLELLSKLNGKDIKSPENINLILENLKQKYTLKEIIDAIISETIKGKNDKENYYTNKSSDINSIISFIYKKIGALRIFKIILDIQSKEDKNEIRKIKESNLINRKRKEDKNERKNILSLPSTVEEDPYEYNINNNIINLNEEDDNNNLNTDIININESDDENNNNNEDAIFSINDNEPLNRINSEIKIRDKSYKLGEKENIESFYINSNKINYKEKCFLEGSKILTNKINNLSYHCSIINGIYFKYKFKSFDKKGIAKFVCFNPKCGGYGIYNLNNKMFTLLKEHNYFNNSFCSKNMDRFDKIYYSYMKINHIEELQITNK